MIYADTSESGCRRYFHGGGHCNPRLHPACLFPSRLLFQSGAGVCYDRSKFCCLPPTNRTKICANTHPFFQVLLWSQIELNAAIICSSIASLRPLFKRVFASTASRSNGQYYDTGNIYTPNRSTTYEMHSTGLKSHDGRANTKIEAQLRGMDNDSQELILDKEHADGIRRTVETQISSEQVDDNEVERYKGRNSPV